MNIDNIKIVNGEYTAKSGSKLLIDLEDISTRFTDVNDSPSDVFEYCKAQKRKSDEAKELRHRIYAEKVQGVLLSEIFEKEVPYCRERSVLAHIILAQKGIPSVIISASSDNSRHSFVLFKEKGQVYVLDAEKKVMQKLGATEKYGVKQYSKDIVAHVLVEPKNTKSQYSKLVSGNSFYY